MKGTRPAERYPAIGTVENPAMLFDGRNLLLAYAIAPVDGGGCAILQFDDVFSFELSPMNIEGLGAATSPVSAWDITEVTGSALTGKWTPLKARFWTLSFNDSTVFVVFQALRDVQIMPNTSLPTDAINRYLTK
jgi:hypothetical protein